MVVLKVTNIDRTKKVGIVAKDFRQFIDKVIRKFNVSDEDSQGCTFQLAKDGVVIEDDEYFQNIAPQTWVIVVLPQEKQMFKTDFDLLMENILKWSRDYISVGNQAKLFIDSQGRTMLKEILWNIEKNEEVDNTEWFKGLDTSAKTKENFMYRRAQDRMRGYFYKTKDDLTHSQEYRQNVNIQAEIDRLIEKFKKLLVCFGHFGYLFDRSLNKDISKTTKYDELDSPKLRPRPTNTDVTMKMNNGHNNATVQSSTEKNQKPSSNQTYDQLENTPKRPKLDFVCNANSEMLQACREWFPPPKNPLCDFTGFFGCQGQWNYKDCVYSDHMINPYVSREYRIIFQTWNLDHQVERARSVVPSILKTAMALSKNEAKCLVHKERNGEHLSVMIYFLELFTTFNLRLVHIVCHDKASHNLSSKGGALCSECSDAEP